MNKWSDGTRPQCEYINQYYYGAERCRFDAVLVVLELTGLTTKLSCEKHLAATVYDLSEVAYEPTGGEHPVLIRQLHRGGIGWPTSDA